MDEQISHTKPNQGNLRDIKETEVYSSMALMENEKILLVCTEYILCVEIYRVC